MENKTRKVVINACYGGFGLSKKAVKRLEELAEEYNDEELLEMIHEGRVTLIDRDHPLLIKVVEELGEEADSQYSCLKIVEIPADVEWEIEEYDGREWVSEKHRKWC